MTAMAGGRHCGPQDTERMGRGCHEHPVPTHDDRVQRTTALEDAICQNSHRTRDDGRGPWLLKKLNRQLRAFRSRKRQLQVGPWRVSHTFREKLYQFCTTPPRVWGQRGDFLTHPGRPALPQYQTQTKKCRKTAEQYLLQRTQMRNLQQSFSKSSPTVGERNGTPRPRGG